MLLIGIFASLALTASLWFLIGIGDAIAFREMAQEATDAAAFSSAVVHARGMNFIAAINLVMFGVTVVYLILAIIADLFGVALITCTGPAYVPCAYGTYGAVPAALAAAEEEFQSSAEDYRDSVVRVTVQTGDQLEKLVARTTPWAGSFAANRVAGRYDRDLVASTIGLSNDPNIEGNGQTTMSTGGSDGGGRLGLPVEAVHASALCDRAFSAFGIGSWTANHSGQNFDFGFTPLKAAVGAAARSIVTSAHCSGDFWDEDGPTHIVDEAQNGSDYMQVYGFMMGAKMKDRNNSDRAVGVLSTMKQNYVAKPPRANVYLSQAEFFLDCTSTWESSACNQDDAAAYSPRWKVRLRRLHSPVAGAQLGLAAAEILTSGAAAIGAQVVGIPDVDDALQRMTDAATAEIGSQLADQMQSFFNVPSLPSSVTSVLPQLGGDVSQLPMPSYLH